MILLFMGHLKEASATVENALNAFDVASESDRLGMPVADPIRGGEEFERLLDRCLHG